MNFPISCVLLCPAPVRRRWKFRRLIHPSRASALMAMAQKALVTSLNIFDVSHSDTIIIFIPLTQRADTEAWNMGKAMDRSGPCSPLTCWMTQAPKPTHSLIFRHWTAATVRTTEYLYPLCRLMFSYALPSTWSRIRVSASLQSLKLEPNYGWTTCPTITNFEWTYALKIIYI